MSGKQTIEVIQSRIDNLNAAYAGLRDRIRHTREAEQREAWEVVLNSIQDELITLRHEADRAFAESHKEHLSAKLMQYLDETEKLVVKAFFVFSTIVGVSNLASHEIAPVQQRIQMIMDQKPATPLAPDSVNKPGKDAAPDYLRLQQQNLDRHLNSLAIKPIPHSHSQAGPDLRGKAISFILSHKLSDVDDLHKYLLEFEGFLKG
jgi:hypothetical protein